MIDVIVPIFICTVFFRADLVWAFIYCAVIVLSTFNVTDAISHDTLPVLYVVTFVFILQIYASFRTRGYRPYPMTIRVTGIFMGLFRLPVNFIFVRGLLLQLGRWHLLPAAQGPASYLPTIAKIADSVEILMLATILLSVILLILHFTLSCRHRTVR